jgi:hypothetical protein
VDSIPTHQWFVWVTGTLLIAVGALNAYRKRKLLGAGCVLFGLSQFTQGRIDDALCAGAVAFFIAYALQNAP